MLEFDDPDIKSITEAFDYNEVGHVGYDSLPLLLLEINRGSDKPVDIDELDYKRYFNVRYKQIEKHFVDGEMKKVIEYFDYERCTEDNY